ncbi:Acyl carrier protein 2 (modular protein) [Cupriavidus oxalaticus]|uniref:Acyl carrier protein 2 (Modular protein) n=2 Tax=Cupriavidus oxalaticus TaxID=96344 RepID=A0A375GJ91_9BURK|nr:Acyl carrier protein 2 (modular protein) [Cupriavidus oxalaticus]
MPPMVPLTVPPMAPSRPRPDGRGASLVTDSIKLVGMAMTHDEIFARIAAVLQDSFEIDADRIRPEARLYEDLDIDSIDAVDLLVKLKPMLDKPLKPEQFKSVRTIEDVVQALALLIDSDSAATA